MPRRRVKRVAIVLRMGVPYRRHVDVLAGIQQRGNELGWDADLIPVEGRDVSLRDVRPFDGIVGRIHPKLARACSRAGVRTVNVWLNTTAPGLDGVFPDWEHAGRLAAAHLQARGLRRFAYVGYAGGRGVDLQLAGFREELGVGPDGLTVHRVRRQGGESFAVWRKLQRLLDEQVASWPAGIGVCVCADLLARQVLNACQRVGLSVPRDAAVIGTQNDAIYCEQGGLALSSIDLRYSMVGMRAASLLDDLMRARRRKPAAVRVEPWGVIARDSTDAYAAADPAVAAALRYMVERCHRRIGVSDVARHVSMARRSLERHFAASTGRSIGQEITRFRIERAKRLLSDADVPVKAVARSCGFRDASRFCTVFRRGTGMTPLQFRTAGH